MRQAGEQPITKSNPGLCGACAHGLHITSDRGSVFWQCQLSFSDSRFVKYPRLPVVECPGYKRKPVADRNS